MSHSIHTNRFAVSVFFFINGFFHANLLARMPLYQSNMGISNSLLGTLLFTTALGAVLAMPLTGGLVDRFGSDKLGRSASVLFCLFLPLIPWVSNFWVAGLLFLLMGASIGSMDVCMNGQAVMVEREMRKPVMSSFHAIFSIGMALGAGAGALFSRFNIPLTTHLGVMAVFSLALVWWAAPRLLPEPKSEKPLGGKAKTFSLPGAAVVPLGLIAFCCMTGEGSMADWSAIYMNKVVGADKAFSAVAFGVYATGMTLGRIFGDYLTWKLGKRQLMIYDSLLTISGLAIALAYISPLTTLPGFFMVGLGVSTIVPIVFSTAGNMEGVHPSAGIAMATSIGYAGFFIAPPVIGFLADHFGLRIGLGFTLTLFVAMFGLVWVFIKPQKRP